MHHRYARHLENVCGCTDPKKKNKLSFFLAAAVDCSDTPGNVGKGKRGGGGELLFI